MNSYFTMLVFFLKKTRIEVFSDGSTSNPAIYNDVILLIPFFLLPVRAQVHGKKKTPISAGFY